MTIESCSCYANNLLLGQSKQPPNCWLTHKALDTTRVDLLDTAGRWYNSSQCSSTTTYLYQYDAKGGVGSLSLHSRVRFVSFETGIPSQRTGHFLPASVTRHGLGAWKTNRWCLDLLLLPGAITRNTTVVLCCIIGIMLSYAALQSTIDTVLLSIHTRL